MEEKLIELETKFSYQEDLLSELNRVVIAQQRQLDELLREVHLIRDQLHEAMEGDTGQQAVEADEKPPHY